MEGDDDDEEEEGDEEEEEEEEDEEEAEVRCPTASAHDCFVIYPSVLRPSLKAGALVEGATKSC